MRRLLALCLLAVPVGALAQGESCADHADFLVDSLPPMQSQMGYDTGADLVADETRLLVAMSLYANATCQLQGPPNCPDALIEHRTFWLLALVAADGLIQCFASDGDGFSEDQLAYRAQFSEAYTEELRALFLDQAFEELGFEQQEGG